MSVQFSLAGIPEKPIQTLGLGVFDGLHRAHQVISDQCDAILTFSPHPDTVLRGQEIPILTTHEEMRSYFPSTIILTFTKEIAGLSPTAFLEKIKLELNPKKIVAGYDYRFGKKREGDMEFLTTWGLENDIEVLTVPAQKEGEELIKSGQIRKDLRQGNFEKACDYLGKSYRIIGTVVQGDGRGKDLGFPTANIDIVEGKLLPLNGVYSASLATASETHKAIAYIGSKPTFKGTQTTLEVHVPNQDLSLYASTVTVELTAFIRGEKKFESSEALIAQIKDDLKTLN